MGAPAQERTNRSRSLPHQSPRKRLILLWRTIERGGFIVSHKEMIERFARKQCEGDYPCPRCGRRVMDEKPIRNALSRRADVYVCDACGILEGIEDIPQNFKLPLSAWAIVKNPAAWGMPLQLMLCVCCASGTMSNAPPICCKTLSHPELSPLCLKITRTACLELSTTLTVPICTIREIICSASISIPPIHGALKPVLYSRNDSKYVWTV